MASRHVVLRAAERSASPPATYEGRSSGFRRWSVVDETSPGAVHTGFGECELDAGGSIAGHVHSYEESVYVLEGEVVLDSEEGSYRLGPGDYGVIPLGVAHAWRNPAGATAVWAEMTAPQPRSRTGDDTQFMPVPERDALAVDPRDPRTRSFGHIEGANMDPGRQTQDMLAVSASMRTALLVYSGITVKMMVDPDLGARLTTMFMVQYEPRGLAGRHDHPFEETYLILEGETDAVFDDETYRLGPGDVAWAGVGCVHGFSNPNDTVVRWLETQAPQPPSRHSYRFERDWTYLRDTLG